MIEIYLEQRTDEGDDGVYVCSCFAFGGGCFEIDGIENQPVG
jgi:hypothetical protein